jgi:uncharacterized repeat protein (TIGR01451 family)
MTAPIHDSTIVPTTAAAALAMLLSPPCARAQPLDSRSSWSGNLDYFATGAPMAVDGPDSDTGRVDTIDQPASVEVTGTDVPSDAFTVAVILYWAGTVEDQDDCTTAPSATDDTVELTAPGAAAEPVTADTCYCAAGAGSYDIQACKADITSLAPDSDVTGTWTVDGFEALIRNSSTDNASFSLVFVYEDTDLPPRRIDLYDGLEEFYESERTLELTGLEADTPAHGELTWYVLDGDIGGAPPEQVEVSGVPGGAETVLSDAHNPFDNPMNRTINTAVPARTGVVGVDIDQLDIGAGLTPGDTAVDMTYTAGGDKYWVVFNIVGIDIYSAVIQPRLSHKSWGLFDDADGSTTPTPGDTVRYTIHVVNSGTAPGYVTVTDTIPDQAATWSLVADAGGTDVSTADTLVVEDLYIEAGGSVDVIFDVVIAEGTLDEIMSNVAGFDAGPDGSAGHLAAPPVYIGGLLPDEAPEEAADDPPEVVEPVVEPAPDVTDAADIPGEDPVEDPGADDTPTGPIVPDGGGTPSACTCSALPVPGGHAWPVSLLLVWIVLQLSSRCCTLHGNAHRPRKGGHGTRT